jgi:hypothetical protein
MFETVTEDELLMLVCTSVNGRCVSAENIVSAGRLVEKGLLRVEEDYEGPVLVRTQDGVAEALKRGLIIMAQGDLKALGLDYERA